MTQRRIWPRSRFTLIANEWFGKPNPYEPFSHAPKVYWTICVLMLLLIVLYVGRGVWKFSTKPSIDMDKRWQEVHTMMSGVDPNTLIEFVRLDVEHFLDESRQGGDMPPYFEEYALPDKPYAIGVYPPYTYAMSIPLLWPDTVGTARAWFFVTMLSSLAVVIVFVHTRYAHALPGGHSRNLVLLPVGTLCSASVMDSIVTGNYTLVVMAALVGMFISLQRNQPVRSGLLLSLAMIKPTIAVPFGFILLFRRRFWPGIAVCAATLAFWSWLAYALTGTSPLASVKSALSHADQFATQGGGLLVVAADIDDTSMATNSIAVATIVCSIGLLLLFLVRRDRLDRAFAIAAVVSILCTYHRAYDHLVLVFLLLFIGRNVLASRQAGASAALESALFFLVIATVFLPTRLIGTNESVNLYREVIWAGCLLLSMLALRKVPIARTLQRESGYS